MGFICTASTRGPHPDPVREGNSYAVAVAIGYDDERHCDYTLLVGLEPLPGGEHEFFFCVIETDVVSGAEDNLWSGLQTSQRMRKYERCLVLECLLSVSEHLLTNVAPKRFVMITHDENLPENALVKFKRLNDIFTKLGYAISEGERRYGKHFWRMERG